MEKKLDELEETSRQISSLEAETEYRERELLHAAESAEQDQADLAAREREGIELAAKRSLLFEGRSVAEVRATVEEQVETARETLRAAQRDLDTADVKLMRVQTTMGSKADHLQSNSDRLAARQAALEQKLRKRGLAEDEARSLLSKGESWCRETRGAIRDYDNEQSRVTERLEERERQLAAHERTRPQPTPKELERRVTETEEQRKSVECVRAGIQARLIHEQSVEDRKKVLTQQLVSLEEEGRVWVE